MSSSNDDPQIHNDQNQVYWHSRRGMLELDLVLMPFAKNKYGELNSQDQQCYKNLLECEDIDLFSWFLKKTQPEDADLAHMVKLILDYAQSTSD